MDNRDKIIESKLRLVDKVSKKGDPYQLIDVIVNVDGKDVVFHSIYVKQAHRQVFQFLLERANAT